MRWFCNIRLLKSSIPFVNLVFSILDALRSSFHEILGVPVLALTILGLKVSWAVAHIIYRYAALSYPLSYRAVPTRHWPMPVNTGADYLLFNFGPARFYLCTFPVLLSTAMSKRPSDSPLLSPKPKKTRNHLTDKNKIFIMQCHIRGHTPAKIAKALGRSPATIYYHINKCQQKNVSPAAAMGKPMNSE